MIEVLGLIIFSFLFIASGLTHIKNHAAMAAYTTTAMGKCPFATQLGYLGGWPIGVYLAICGVGTALNDSNVYAYGLAAFLAVAIAIFHRNLKDPANMKTVALLGAALYIASQVS